MNKLLILFLLFFVSTVQAELMSPTVGACDFYLQLEQEKQCGAKSYLQNYGLKYCQKFLFQKNHKFRFEGKIFATRAGLCLQQFLWNQYLNDREITCSKVERDAIKSHTSCYYQSGFCQLSFHDKMVIFSTIKKELLKKSYRKQALRMLQICRQH